MNQSKGDNFLYYLVIFIFLFAGCQNEADIMDINVSRGIEVTQTSEVMDSNTSTTINMTSNSESNLVIETDQLRQCSPVSGLTDVKLKGQIIFLKEGSLSVVGDRSVQTLIDKLQTTRVIPIGVSPNNRWFAYYIEPMNSSNDLPQIEIVDLDGSGKFSVEGNSSLVKQQPSSDIGSWVGVKWIANDLILVPVLLGYSGSKANIELYSVNPFDSTWTYSIVENLADYSHLYGSFGLSPDSSLLLYVQSNWSEQGTHLELVLRDLVIDQILWQSPLVGQSLQHSGGLDELHSIAWSSDSKKVAWSGKSDASSNSTHEEIFLLDVSNLELSTLTTPEKEESTIFHGLSWSPDNRLLATRAIEWNNNQSSSIEELRIYDSFDKSLLLDCDIQFEINNFATYPIVWSPNGTQIAIMGKGESQGNFFQYPIHVLDLATGKLLKNVSEGKLVGWIEDSGS